MPSPTNPAPPPQFQTSGTLWPLQGMSEGNGSGPAASTKSKNRSRNRKKAAQSTTESAPPAGVSAAPNPPGASSKSSAQAGQDRTSFPWRGSGRGRGRGGANSNRGGAAAKQASNHRAFSTAAAELKGVGEAGIKVQRTPLFQSTQARGNRRGVQTDATTPASASQPANSATSGQQAPRRGGGAGGRGAAGARGRGRGKGKAPPGDRGVALLDQVRLQAGEDDLAEQIKALYDIQRPSPESIAAREHLISELTDYLNRERFHWGHPHSPSAMPLSIEPFGSIRFGLGTSKSDLDLCLLDPYRPNGFEDKWYSSRKEHLLDLPDIYQMRKIGSSLYRAGLDNIHPIPDAAVPICKFEVQIDGHTIQADLNTNERLGVYNSRLLNSYCNLHPLVRPLSVFVKFWAAQRGLNNPSGDRDGVITFSSYTLILLVISYLQKIKLLPNLQDEELITSSQTERIRFFSTPKAYSRRGKLRHLIRSVGWDVTFVEYDEVPEGYHPSSADLVDLARGFFHYFGDEFDPKKDVVSIANGAPFARERAFGQPLPKSTPAQRDESQERKPDHLRQEVEVSTLEVLAEEEQARNESRQSGGAAQVDDLTAEVDAIAQAQSELDQERTKSLESRRRVQSDAASSSSPIPYGDFSEPDKWTEHMLVVQDPFILTRNCAGNVKPDWVEELRIQMRRARDLIDNNAPLAKICLHHCSDPEYLPIAFAKQRAKQAQQKKQREDALAKRLQAQSTTLQDDPKPNGEQQLVTENSTVKVDGDLETPPGGSAEVAEEIPKAETSKEVIPEMQHLELTPNNEGETAVAPAGQESQSQSDTETKEIPRGDVA
ncbi:uncharacterized protein JCM15063_006142 [Sporobolomyces koalae]|uniref:uncharacterized protein n=1 Tax=Sporobolomyces koalae TaxID=500713 RepID=UPI00316DC57B